MARKKQAPPPPPVPTPASMMGLLSPRQVAIGLGNVGLSTLYKMIRKGQFPKPDLMIGENGTLPRWSVALFNRWIEEQVERHKNAPN